MPTLLSRIPVAERVPQATIRQSVLTDLEKIDNYPTLSDTTIRAMGMVNNPDVSSAEIAAIIQRDSILAAAVLRMANNWMYRGRREVDDIQQAVLRLGLKECGKLLCTMGLRGLAKNLPPVVHKRCETLLRHGLFVAHLAAGINRNARLKFAGVEFTAGLMHDIGRLIACVKAPFDFAAVDPIDFSEDAEDILQHERQQLGIDHCAIGYHFATKNNLPEAIVRVILNHHRPDDERFQQELVALVAVADRIANFAQREHKITGYDLSECPFYPFLVRSWTTERRDALRMSLNTIVVQSLRETRQMLKAFG